MTVEPSTTSPPQRVTVTDIDIPFGSMVAFMIKWAIATIPAVLILAFISGAIFVFFGTLGVLGIWGTQRASSASSISNAYGASTPSDSRAAYESDLREWQTECRNDTSPDCAMRKTVLDMRDHALPR